MTYEQQLDEAFKFLVKWKHGSFKYYLHNGKNIGENFPELNITDESDKLEWYLKSVGIDERFTMPLIYHLIHDGYVDANWQPNNPKENGNPPDQIKITWKGIIFWNNGKGGYVNEKNRKTIERWYDYFKPLIAALIGAIVAVVLTSILKTSPPPSQSPNVSIQHIQNQNSASDTVFVGKKIDTSK